MKLDLVHDTQLAYRKLMDSMSRPGLISELGELAGKVGLKLNCFDATVLLAAVLLDTEVTFKIISEKEEEIVRLFNQLTYAKAAETAAADFIFVLNDANSFQLEEAIRKAKAGDLIHPHASATFIVEAEQITNDNGLVLSGPGIEDTHHVQVSTCGSESRGSWLDERALRNIEYPLGIDMIFVDRDSRTLCLPRTTQISKKVNN
ncbi:phosphonate C-P lyase system protein PhnH [Paenibacillus glucanolyticus]